MVVKHEDNTKVLQPPKTRLVTDEDYKARRTEQGNLIKWVISRSPWIIVFGTGCCALELMNSFTTRFDIERFGAITAEIPRKADILVVTGLINRNVGEIIRRVYEQMPEPKYVIALGACAMGGGPYHDSYSTLKSVDEIVPVDVYVPGCPIRAEGLIEGLRELQKKIYGKPTG